MVENFPNLLTNVNLNIQESQPILHRINGKKSTHKYIIIKMPKSKDKDNILKAAREISFITYKGNPIIVTTLSFSAEITESKRYNQSAKK